MTNVISADGFEEQFGITAMEIAEYADQFGYYGEVINPDGGQSGSETYCFYIPHKNLDAIEIWLK